MKRLAIALVLYGGVFCAVLSAQEQEPSNALLGWKWANFIILVIGLGYLIGKYLPPVFSSRTEEIQKGIVEAQAMKRDAEQRAAEMEKKLAALGDEIEKFSAQAHAEMEQEGARIAENTRRSLEKLQHQAELEIETAGKIAQRQLRGYAAQLALDLAETRIRKMLDPATDAALIEEFVRDLVTSRSEASKN
jgi:F0F1-type ATP synthase membrane subunit b/b'